MRNLLNTLYITSENGYATLDGENVVIKIGDEITGRFPLHNLNGIISFSYAGASPALMGACAKRGISLAFCTPGGRFLARATGESHGNVLLRRKQYRVADSDEESCLAARCMVFGKLNNSRSVIERALRDHPARIDTEAFRTASLRLKELSARALDETDLDTLRGIEGVAAETYFSCFDGMILGDKDSFFYNGRSRRPPTDNVNAMLSFTYTVLANDCASALESVGLDAYVGFMHSDRPGRRSLALDLMEELRPCFADRFVLSMINTRVMSEKDFERQENGAVLMTDEAKKKLIQSWQKRKHEEITHPFLNEKLPWGLVPYVQALLLARYLRGDLDAYPAFLWK